MLGGTHSHPARHSFAHMHAHTDIHTHIHTHIHPYTGLPGGASGKEPACNAGDIRDLGSVPGSGRPPGGGHSNPPQYSCLENPMDRGAWRATVHGVAESWTRLSDLASQQAHPYTDRHSCNTHTCTHMYHSRMHTFTHSRVHTDALMPTFTSYLSHTHTHTPSPPETTHRFKEYTQHAHPSVRTRRSQDSAPVSPEV